MKKNRILGFMFYGVAFIGVLLAFGSLVCGCLPDPVPVADEIIAGKLCLRFSCMSIGCFIGGSILCADGFAEKLVIIISKVKESIGINKLAENL